MNKPCPQCAGNLSVRYNAKTDTNFLGCSNYPSCTYTETLTARNSPQPEPATEAPPAGEPGLSAAGKAALRVKENAVDDAIKQLNEYAQRLNCVVVEMEFMAMQDVLRRQGFEFGENVRQRLPDGPDGEERWSDPREALTDEEQQARADYWAQRCAAILKRNGPLGGNLPYDKNEREPGITRTDRKNPDLENR